MFSNSVYDEVFKDSTNSTVLDIINQDDSAQEKTNSGDKVFLTRNKEKALPKIFLLSRNYASPELITEKALKENDFNAFRDNYISPLITKINDTHLFFAVHYVSNRKRIEELNSLDSVCLERVMDVGVKVKELEKELDELSELKTQVEVLKKIENESISLRGEKYNLEAMLKEGKSSLQLKSDYEQAVKKLADNEKEIDELKEKNKNMLLTAADAEGKYLDMSKTFNEVSSKLETLSEENKQLLRNKKMIEGNLKNCETEYMHMRTINSQKQEEIDELRTEISKGKKDMGKLEDEYNRINYLYTNLKGKESRILADIKNFNIAADKISYLKREIINITRAVRKGTQDLEKKIYNQKHNHSIMTSKTKMIILNLERSFKTIKSIEEKVNKSANIYDHIQKEKDNVLKESIQENLEQKAKSARDMKKLIFKLRPFLIANGTGFQYLKEKIEGLETRKEELLKKLSDESYKNSVDPANDDLVFSRIKNLKELDYINKELFHQTSIIIRYNDLVDNVFTTLKKYEKMPNVSSEDGVFLKEYADLLTVHNRGIRDMNKIKEMNTTLRAKNKELEERMSEIAESNKVLLKANETDSNIVKELKQGYEDIENLVNSKYNQTKADKIDLEELRIKLEEMSNENSNLMASYNKILDEKEEQRKEFMKNIDNHIDKYETELNADLDTIITLLKVKDDGTEFNEDDYNGFNTGRGRTKNKQYMIIQKAKELMNKLNDKEEYIKNADYEIANIKKQNESLSKEVATQNNIIRELKERIENGVDGVANISKISGEYKTSYEEYEEKKKQLEKEMKLTEDARIEIEENLRLLKVAIFEQDKYMNEHLEEAINYISTPMGYHTEESKQKLLLSLTPLSKQHIILNNMLSGLLTPDGIILIKAYRGDMLRAITNNKDDHIFSEEGLEFMSRFIGDDDGLTPGQTILFVKEVEDYISKEISVYENSQSEPLSNEIVVNESEDSNRVNNSNEDLDDNEFAESDHEDDYRSDHEDDYKSEYGGVNGRAEDNLVDSNAKPESIPLILFHKLKMVDINSKGYKTFLSQTLDRHFINSDMNNKSFFKHIINNLTIYEETDKLYNFRTMHENISDSGHGALIKSILEEQKNNAIENNENENYRDYKFTNFILSLAKPFNEIVLEKRLIDDSGMAKLFTRKSIMIEGRNVNKFDVITSIAYHDIERNYKRTEAIKDMTNKLKAFRTDILDTTFRDIIPNIQIVKDKMTLISRNKEAFRKSYQYITENKAVIDNPLLTNGLTIMENRSRNKRVSDINNLMTKIKTEDNLKDMISFILETHSLMVDDLISISNKYDRSSRCFSEFTSYRSSVRAMSVEIMNNLNIYKGIVSKIVYSIKDTIEQIKQKQSEFSNLREENIRLKNDISVLEKSINKMDSQKNSYVELLNNMTNKMKSVNAVISKLKNQKDSNTESMSKYLNNIDNITRSITRYNATIRDCKDKIERLSHLEILKHSIGEEAKEMIINMTKELETNQTGSEYEDILIRLRSLNERLNSSEIADRENESGLVRVAIQDIQKITDKLSNGRDIVTNVISALEPYAKKIEDTFVNNRYELDGARKQLETLELEKSNSVKQLLEYKNIVKELDASIISLDSKLFNLNAQVNNISIQMKIAKENHESVALELNVINRHKEELYTKLRGYDETINSIAGEVKLSKDKIVKMLNAMAEMENNSGNNHDKTACGEMINNVLKTVGSVSETNSKGLEDIEYIKSIFTILKNRLDSDRITKSDYVSINKDLNAQIKGITKRYNDLEAQNILLKDKISSLEASKLDISGLTAISDLLSKGDTSALLKTLKIDIKEINNNDINGIDGLKNSLLIYLESQKTAADSIKRNVEDTLIRYSDLREMIRESVIQDSVRLLSTKCEQYQEKIKELESFIDENIKEGTSNTMSDILNKIEESADSVNAITKSNEDIEKAIEENNNKWQGEINNLKKEFEDRILSDSEREINKIIKPVLDMLNRLNSQITNIIKSNIELSSSNVSQIQRDILIIAKSIENIKEKTVKEYGNKLNSSIIELNKKGESSLQIITDIYPVITGLIQTISEGEYKNRLKENIEAALIQRYSSQFEKEVNDLSKKFSGINENLKRLYTNLSVDREDVTAVVNVISGKVKKLQSVRSKYVKDINEISEKYEKANAINTSLLKIQGINDETVKFVTQKLENNIQTNLDIMMSLGTIFKNIKDMKNYQKEIISKLLKENSNNKEKILNLNTENIINAAKINMLKEKIIQLSYAAKNKIDKSVLSAAEVALSNNLTNVEFANNLATLNSSLNKNIDKNTDISNSVIQALSTIKRYIYSIQFLTYVLQTVRNEDLVKVKDIKNAVDIAGDINNSLNSKYIRTLVQKTAKLSAHNQLLERRVKEAELIISNSAIAIKNMLSNRLISNKTVYPTSPYYNQMAIIKPAAPIIKEVVVVEEIYLPCKNVSESAPVELETHLIKRKKKELTAYDIAVKKLLK